MAAFFDDSGELDPGSGHNFVCLGMIVLSINSVREVSTNWNNLIASHLRLSPKTLAINGIEAKSSELYALSKRLKSGQAPKGLQIPLYNWGLKTPNKVDELIESIWGFLSMPEFQRIYLASISNKYATLRKYKSEEYDKFLEKQKTGTKESIKNLRRELSLFISGGLFQFLLQRLNYLGNSTEWDFSDAFLIGDEGAVNNFMYESQAAAQAGLSKYTDLPKIANNIWFGSSSHNPCIQMADWIACAVRTWAEKKQGANMRLKGLLPYFRGFPNDVLGWGIIPIPSPDSFPKIPK